MTQYTGEVQDDIGLIDDAFGWAVSPLVDGFTISDTLASNISIHGMIDDQMAFGDFLSTVLKGEVSDAIALTDEAGGWLRLLGEITDALIISGRADSRLSAIGAVVDAFVLDEQVKQYFAGFVEDSFSLADSPESKVSLIGSVADAMTFDDVPVPNIRLYGTVDDTVAIGDEVGSLVRLIGAIEDGFAFSAIIQLPGLEFLAYVVNPKLLATTTYDNFPFNSFAELNGVYYGLTDSGLYQLNGATDDGSPIQATIKTGFTNLGSVMRKNVPRAYFGYTADGQLLFKTITSHSGAKIERWYKLLDTAEAFRESRVKLSRGVVSTYWQFELQNVDGSDFSLDTVKLFPVALGRVIG